METVLPLNQEAQDADRVDAARHALHNGNITFAESLLLSVIANTPPDYVNESEEDDGSLTIRDVPFGTRSAADD